MKKEVISAYPLSWPKGLPREKKPVSSLFKTTISGALKNVNNSLIAFGKDSGTPTENIVISSNVTLGAEKPKDAGVSVWFVWENKQLCVAVDKYQKVEDNLQAIYHIIESRRTELRHGGLHILRQSFTGFKALPETVDMSNDFVWEFLGLNNKPDSKEEVEKNYKLKAKQLHPDVATGSTEKFNMLQQVYKKSVIIFRLISIFIKYVTVAPRSKICGVALSNFLFVELVDKQ